jgi:hypothetical protein
MNKNRTILIVVAGFFCAAAFAEAATNEVTEPFVGVRVIHSKDTKPRQIDMWIVEIDPHAPGIRFAVTPSNGSLTGDTTPQTTRAFVTKVKAQIGINGSFFASAGNGQFDVSGLCVSKGDAYSPFQRGFVDAINISKDNVATIIRGTGREKNKLVKPVSKTKSKTPSPNPLPKGEGSNAALVKPQAKVKPPVVELGLDHDPGVSLYNALSGKTRLVEDGKNVAGKDPDIHPRTAIGIKKDGKLLLFTVDGRESGRSMGLKLNEMADILIKWGSRDAISLDGGGSTTFVMDDPATLQNDPKVMNLPCDPFSKEKLGKEHGKERAVGNSLAVFARRRS